MITNVFIDVDNTLLDFHKCGEISIRKGFEKANLIYKDSYFDVFTEINDALWLSLERNEITKDELYDRRFRMVFDRLKIDADGKNFEKIFKQFLSESCELVDGADDIVKYLSSKYSVYAASNGPYIQQCNRLEKAQLKKYMTAVFTSEQIGYSKPDIRFYNACMEKAGIDSVCSIVMIGDSLTADIAGGKNAGMKTCWYNYSKKKDYCTGDFDYMADSLADIKKYL